MNNMTQPTVPAIKLADPLEVFHELCETKAFLWAHYQIELPDAVDQLQAWAMENGLVALIGQDEVQRLMAESCALVHSELDEEQPTEAELAVEYDVVEREIFLGAADLVRRWEMADPRDRWRHSGEPPLPDGVRNGDIAGRQVNIRQPYHPPKATRQAFWFVVQSADRKALNDWLARHPADAPFLLKIWKEKNARQVAKS